MPVSQKQRELIEALKLSPYVCVSFEFGDRPILIKVENKLFAHDVGIALQTYFLSKNKQERRNNNG